MTLSISTGVRQYIELCPSYPMSDLPYAQSYCIAATTGSERNNSVVFAFTAKAGSAIGFQTTTDVPPYTGTYDANIVLELLAGAPPAQ
jgi:hypothetical protein